MLKAVAIPYVIALILGVIVIGILAYWFVSQSNKTTNVGASTECQGRVFSYCIQWQNNNNCGNDKPEPLTGCGTPEKSDCEKIGICK